MYPRPQQTHLDEQLGIFPNQVREASQVFSLKSDEDKSSAFFNNIFRRKHLDESGFPFISDIDQSSAFYDNNVFRRKK